jgi:hypothetical protein
VLLLMASLLSSLSSRLSLNSLATFRSSLIFHC